MYKFSLDKNQIARLEAWMQEKNEQAVAAQRANPPSGVPIDLLESFWEEGYPYGGAIGGNYTFSFTPTSIGVVVTVTDSHTRETIDISDYELW